MMRAFALLLSALLALPSASHAFGFWNTSQSQCGTIEVGFSPGGAEDLVVKTIQSASRDIKVLAYAFTSARITKALLQTRKRGVAVTIVADYKSAAEDRSGKTRAALSALASAGADVRLNGSFPIHHDKVIIVDGETVQTGSFNYSQQATRNSENAIVVWHNPGVAAEYTRHFERNYQSAIKFNLRY